VAPQRSNTPLFVMIRFLNGFVARGRVAVGIGVAIIVFLSTLGIQRLPLRIILTWDGFALTVIALAWVRMVFANAKEAITSAKAQDASRTIIFITVLIGACGSLFAVAYLLRTAKGATGSRLVEDVAMAAMTVVCSWFLIHTIFALHYAHAYYRQVDEGGERGDGLNFPECDEPDFLDFAYFSFVIGMTFQVSDVSIASRYIRRLSLVHGILSFLFNTVILALAINLASGLLQ
jgi:uncharacterized membrane protein